MPGYRGLGDFAGAEDDLGMGLSISRLLPRVLRVVITIGEAPAMWGKRKGRSALPVSGLLVHTPINPFKD